VKPLNYKAVLWENVAALMQHHWGGENLTRLAREAKVGPGTCSRIKAQQTSVGVDIIATIAAVWDLQPWHMMVPNLDPANPPVLWITRTEADLYRRMREAAKELPNL
jgi:hypothetical protein